MYLKMRREGLPVSRWALRVGQCPPKGEGPEEWAKQALTAGKGVAGPGLAEPVFWKVESS